MFDKLFNVPKEMKEMETRFKELEKEQEESYKEHRSKFDEMKKDFQEMEANTNIGSFDNFLYGFRFGK